MPSGPQDLRPILANAKSGSEFAFLACDLAVKNSAASACAAGVIDALRYAKAIDLEAYNNLYDSLVYSSTCRN